MPEGRLVAGCVGCNGWHRGNGVSHNRCDTYSDVSHDDRANGLYSPLSNELNPITGHHWCWEAPVDRPVEG